MEAEKLSAPVSTGTNKRSIQFHEPDKPSKHSKVDPALSTNVTVTATKDSGLSKTIKELFDNYIPNSEFEKRPFWCRCCKHLSANSEEYELHLASKEHDIIVKEDRKRSSCTLCHRQFTSPEQLKEHLQGAKHKEKLATVKEMQLQQKKFR